MLLFPKRPTKSKSYKYHQRSPRYVPGSHIKYKSKNDRKSERNGDDDEVENVEPNVLVVVMQIYPSQRY